MKKFNILFLALLFFSQLQAQVGIGTTTPNANAVLEVVSTSQGVGFPQLTTAQRDVISLPATGLTIYNTTTNALQTNAGTSSSPDWRTWSVEPSSNGTSVVSAYTCSTASAGTMVAGTAVSGVTQTITATVTTVGTYNISAVANGVTYNGTGTFSGTGAQTAVLTATGTPTATTYMSFALNTTPNCSFIRTGTTAIVDVTSTTGSVWMDRNLGATQVATSSTDAASYGDLYQWGRNTDGHQIRTSATVAGPVVSGAEGTSFITSVDDWLSTQDDTRWNSGTEVAPVKVTANDPCPTGFRVPTESELDAERVLFATQNAAGAWGSVLKLPVAGYRRYSTGARTSVGSRGYYWSSTVSGTDAGLLRFVSSTAYMNSDYRAGGFSVRCIKE
jgi:uncharacterized protein (TIGR02145 family)